MYGNGAVIGMAITALARRPTLKDQLRALHACTVVAVGAAARGAAECRFATATTQTAGATTWGCALLYRLLGIRLIS